MKPVVFGFGAEGPRSATRKPGDGGAGPALVASPVGQVALAPSSASRTAPSVLGIPQRGSSLGHGEGRESIHAGEEAPDGPNREPIHDPTPDGPVPAAGSTAAPEAAVEPPIAPLTRLSQESLRAFSGRGGEVDLVVATALHLILWRAWVGVWP